MSNLPVHTHGPALLERVVLALVAAVVYLGLPAVRGNDYRPRGQFHRLAESFLHGRLTIEVPAFPGQSVDELIPAGEPGQFFCAYPPLPAVLLMPFVVALESAATVETACRVVSVANLVLFTACLWRLPQRLGMAPLTVTGRAALTMLLALGTVCWHNAQMGGDWHLAHAAALAAMLLALREFLAGGRPFFVGCFVACAVLTRPTAALTGLFFALPLIRARHVPQLVRLLAPPAAAVLLLAMYNHARFGSPTDFGYEHMLLREPGRAAMDRYGQFSLHFLPQNAFWYFLAPPWPLARARFPYLGFDLRGLSLFAATPALLYALGGLWRKRRLSFVQDAAGATALCLLPLLMYFNTGYAQFGHRFSMDYLPPLMILVVAGMAPRLSRWAYGLIALSVLIQAVGVLLEPVAVLPAWLVPNA